MYQNIHTFKKYSQFKEFFLDEYAKGANRYSLYSALVSMYDQLNNKAGFNMETSIGNIVIAEDDTTYINPTYVDAIYKDITVINTKKYFNDIVSSLEDELGNKIPKNAISTYSIGYIIIDGYLYAFDRTESNSTVFSSYSVSIKDNNVLTNKLIEANVRDPEISKANRREFNKAYDQLKLDRIINEDNYLSKCVDSMKDMAQLDYTSINAYINTIDISSIAEFFKHPLVQYAYEPNISEVALQDKVSKLKRAINSHYYMGAHNIKSKFKDFDYHVKQGRTLRKYTRLRLVS